MSEETTAALLGALVGAVITVLITLLTRLWASRDARAASRRLYSEHAEKRLQGFISAQSDDELDALNHESFGVSGMGRYVPSRAAAVHVWFVFQQGRLFRDAVARTRAQGQGDHAAKQVQLYGDAIDVLSELNDWARGSLNRSAAWFWWQLQTTDRYEWVRGRKLGREEEKKIVAARRRKAREARERLRGGASQRPHQSSVTTE